MRRFVLILAFSMLLSVPVMAEETVLVPEPTPAPAATAPDELASVPMGCLMPSMGSPLADPMGTGGSAAATGVNNVFGFLADTGIYVNCMGRRLWEAFKMDCQNLANKIGAAMKKAQEKK